MKEVRLTYHDDFMPTPISGWAGARWYGWVNPKGAGGQYRKPEFTRHPFTSQRKKWCLLEVHFDGVDLRFVMPEELDLFLDVMSQNPLPSGQSLIAGCPLGRPNRHWLSRLPKKAKPLKFRQAVCRYLKDHSDVARFRDFYSGAPIKFEFDGFYSTRNDALLARSK
ncbi:hypothetical protein [Halovulum sp. GXIMD14793]